jgi:hypothetical protein
MLATKYGEFHFVSWSGKESNMWSEWINEFEPYLNHSDDRIKEIAKLAIKYATDKRKIAYDSERQRDIIGR